MRPLAYAAALTLLAQAAIAQPALAQIAATPTTPVNLPRYDTAPWWMAQPIIASLGEVKTEMRANRASLNASFQAVEPTADRATQGAADKIKALVAALAAYGLDRVETRTSFTITPLYDQYRDKDGNLQSNQRADKIDRYQANANVVLTIRDVRLVEEIYAKVVSQAPTSVGQVYFTLEPGNEARTKLSADAVADATRRARLAAEGAGARLGAVKLIDPTGRACQTDVLVAGASRSYGGGEGEAYAVSADAPAPPPLPIPPVERRVESGGRGLNIQVAIQPPMQTLQESACVVYALN